MKRLTRTESARTPCETQQNRTHRIHTIAHLHTPTVRIVKIHSWRRCSARKQPTSPLQGKITPTPFGWEGVLSSLSGGERRGPVPMGRVCGGAPRVAGLALGKSSSHAWALEVEDAAVERDEATAEELEVEVTAITLNSSSRAIAAVEACERSQEPTTFDTADHVVAVIVNAICPSVEVLAAEESVSAEHRFAPSRILIRQARFSFQTL